MHIYCERREFSELRLGAIADLISKSTELAKLPDLCLFATGSYARREASQHSDLDVFAIDVGSTCSKISWTVIAGDLIKIGRSLNIPEFSDDGRYLHMLQL